MTGWYPLAALGATVAGCVLWALAWYGEDRARRRRHGWQRYAVRPDERDTLAFFKRRNS